MNSPSHKENLMNPKYRDIGVAVEDGNLQGQRTTLVVQEFGATEAINPAPIVALSASNAVPQATPSPIENPTPEPTPTTQPVINVAGQQLNVPPQDSNKQAENKSLVDSSISPKVTGQPLFDPFTVSKVVGLSLAGLISFLLILDFLVLRARGVFRFSSHHLAHLSLIIVLVLGLLIIARGSII